MERAASLRCISNCLALRLSSSLASSSLFCEAREKEIGGEGRNLGLAREKKIRKEAGGPSRDLKNWQNASRGSFP